jgi:hypothetical protein
MIDDNEKDGERKQKKVARGYNVAAHWAGQRAWAVVV